MLTLKSLSPIQLKTSDLEVDVRFFQSVGYIWMSVKIVLHQITFY